MKGSLLLQFAALSTAFVIPDQQVNNLEHVEVQHHARPGQSALDRLSKSDVLNKIDDALGHVTEEIESLKKEAAPVVEETVVDILGEAEELGHQAKHAFDDAMTFAEDQGEAVKDWSYEKFFDTKQWLDAAMEMDTDPYELEMFQKRPCHGKKGDKKDYEDASEGLHDGKPPHHDKPPHDGPPHDGPPHDGPPHHKPGHGRGPHKKSNLTVYQLISTSKYTTKLTELINQYTDLVDALNSTSTSNFTIFAPTDKAFEKIPEHAPKPSKEDLKKILSYHISPELYPAGRILVSKTIPSLLVSESLAEKPKPQRLSTNIGPKGLTINFYSRVVAVDIFGSNGVIHGVDSIILPPPKVLRIVDLLPTEFSTLELGLAKTGLYETLNTTDHNGGTFFAPSNFAFAKLGPKINAFLFSKFGLKYLKALLEYHVVPEQTLYSDAFYGPESDSESYLEAFHHGKHHGGKDEKHHGPPPPKGDKHHGPPPPPKGDHHGPPPPPKGDHRGPPPPPKGDHHGPAPPPGGKHHGPPPPPPPPPPHHGPPPPPHHGEHPPSPPPGHHNGSAPPHHGEKPKSFFAQGWELIKGRDEDKHEHHNDNEAKPHGPPHKVPKGLFHVTLPTLLDDKTLSIDIARYGRLIDIKINGFSRVTIADGVGEDGVLHLVSDVLIPPKSLNGEATEEETELTVEELMARLEPYVKEVEEEWMDL